MTTETSPAPTIQPVTRDFLTIVSGLPRTGTSMMMRILEAGGLPALTDELREADVDNPNGYYEFEPVKKTKQDPSWLDASAGKAVKMVYLLLYDLPPTHQYRVVFMQRDLEEVIASQNKMLARNGKANAEIDDATMMQLFRGHLAKIQQWLPQQPNFDVLPVNYRDVLSDARTQAERIAEFLGGGLDVDAMASVVDPALYRNRR